MVNNILWLVVEPEPTPLKHMKVSWDDDIPFPTEWKVIKFMFQPPNQLLDPMLARYEIWYLCFQHGCFWSDFSRRSYQQTEGTRRFCQDLFAQMWAPSGVSMLEGEGIIENHQALRLTLSGWWFQPLWKIWKSVGMIIPNIWKNKKCSKPPTSYTLCDLTCPHWYIYIYIYIVVWSRLGPTQLLVNCSKYKLLPVGNPKTQS